MCFLARYIRAAPPVTSTLGVIFLISTTAPITTAAATAAFDSTTAC